jgi:hypothetical protein
VYTGKVYIPEMATMKNQNQNWNKGMSIEDILSRMDDREIAKNARKGGVAAIAEQQRRRAQPAPEVAADIRGYRHIYAVRIMPDPELDIGV